MQRSVRRASHYVGGFDPWLTGAFFGLICVGVLMVYSASIHDAYMNYGSAYYVAEREVVWALIGLVAMAVAAQIPYDRWRTLALPLFGLSLLLLAVVFNTHLGHASKGARRWISLTSGVTIEPSELVKLALVVYLAAWLASKGDRVRDLKGALLPFSVMTGMVAFMIEKQPDLGTTIVVCVTAFSMFYIAGADIKHIAIVLSTGGMAAWALSHSSNYRNARLLAFMNPWQDPMGKGWHTVQALLALGSGGLIGKGFGNSVQKNWLPAPHTDSILAVIGEEWGLVGTTGVLLLFLVIAYRGMRIALTAPDKFSRLLAAGITCWITFQALLNFAVITSSVPFTGVPLPFVSYGGTSLIISMTAIGILLNISRHSWSQTLAGQGTDNGRRDRRSRVPRVINHSVTPIPEPSGLLDVQSAPRTVAPKTRPRRPAARRLGSRATPKGGD